MFGVCSLLVFLLLSAQYSESANAPLNDLCTDAVPIYLGSTYKGTNVGATLDFPTGPTHACVVPYYESGLVWYKVLGTGKKLTATTISPLTINDLDTVLYVFDADVCGSTIVEDGDHFTVNNPFCVDANDDVSNDGSSHASRVSWCSEEGKEYLVAVGGWEVTEGVFGLTVSESGECGYPALNGKCSKATPIELDTWYHSTTEDAPRVNSVWPGFCSATTWHYHRVTAPAVWYSFVGTGDVLTIESSNFFPWIQFPHMFRIWRLHKDTCEVLDDGESIAWNSAPECIDGNVAPKFLTVYGARYVMAVEGPSGLRAPIDFRVTTYEPACKNAETETLVDFAGTVDGSQFVF